MMIWSEKTDDTQKQRAGGVVVNVPHRQALLMQIETELLADRGFGIATLNLDHVVKLRTSPEFLAAYMRHSLVTADGNPIVWLSRLAGQDVSLIPGSELIEPVVEIATRHALPIALFGSTPASLDGAGTALEKAFPGLKIAARLAPPMGFDPTGPAADVLIDELAASGARICFLALGAPKQEIFAARAMGRLPQIGFLSIGAGLDFIAGHQRRAPKIIRLMAAEWLWRFASNPRRLAARYMACIAILPGLCVQALRTRRRLNRGMSR